MPGAASGSSTTLDHLVPRRVERHTGLVVARVAEAASTSTAWSRTARTPCTIAPGRRRRASSASSRLSSTGQPRRGDPAAFGLPVRWRSSRACRLRRLSRSASARRHRSSSSATRGLVAVGAGWLVRRRRSALRARSAGRAAALRAGHRRPVAGLSSGRTRRRSRRRPRRPSRTLAPHRLAAARLPRPPGAGVSACVDLLQLGGQRRTRSSGASLLTACARLGDQHLARGPSRAAGRRRRGRPAVARTW